MFLVEKLSFEQITLLYYTVHYTHILLTYSVALSLIIVLIKPKVWQLYFVVGIFLIQQCLLNGCFLSSFENILAEPIGKELIPNIFMLGVFENNYLSAYKELIRLFLLFVGIAYCFLGYKVKKNLKFTN